MKLFYIVGFVVNGLINKLECCCLKKDATDFRYLLIIIGCF